MHLTNNYWYFTSAISKEICQKIISLGSSKLEENLSLGIPTKGTTVGRRDKTLNRNTIPLNEKTFKELEKTGEDINNYHIRDSEVCWLNEKWLYDIILSHVNESNELAKWRWNLDACEDIQFTRYENTNFYGWHKDGMSDHLAKYKRFISGVTPKPLTPDGDYPPPYTKSDTYVGKIRKISVSINLDNENTYEGGNLKFRIDGEDITIPEFRKQGTIILFPSFVEHCVTPVTKGVRHSLVTWCLGDPWK